MYKGQRMVASLILTASMLMPLTVCAAQDAGDIPDGEDYHGYVPEDWISEPIVVDDNTTIQEIEKMSEGHAVDVETGKPEAEVKSEHIVRGNDSLPSSFPAPYTNEQEIVSALSQRLAPARNQGGYGTCWAHEAIGLAEAYMVNQGGKPTSLDYSERHLAYTTYACSSSLMGISSGLNTINRGKANTEEIVLNRGGNLTDAAKNLMNWRGAANESVAPYSGGSVNWSNIEFSSAARLKNYYVIDRVANRDVIKRYIRDFGGAGVSLYLSGIDSGFYNKNTKAYYCEQSLIENHGVMIVGWDDSFPKGNFNTSPEGDGAWLIRNSYKAGGTLVSDPYNSYFWLSYYDKSMSDTVGVYEMQSSDAFSDNNYYYDNTFGNNSGITSTGKIKAANVFTAKKDERIDSVSIQTLSCGGSSDKSYRIEIYTNLSNKNKPDSGTLAAVQEGELPFLGKYTIEIDTPVTVKKGKTFAAVVTVCGGARTVDTEGSGTRGGTSQEAFTYKGNTYNIIATMKAASGQSFYSTSNGSWVDSNANGNFYIGVQTSNTSGGGSSTLPNTDSEGSRGILLIIFALGAAGAGVSRYAGKHID